MTLSTRQRQELAISQRELDELYQAEQQQLANEQKKKLLPIRVLTQQLRATYSLPTSVLNECQDRELPADYGENYPVLDDPKARDGEADADVMAQWWAKVGEQILVSESGAFRFSKYLRALIIHRHIQVTPESLQTALIRLNYLGCFQPGEIVKGEIPLPSYAKQPQPEVEHRPGQVRNSSGEIKKQTDEFEDVTLSTREGRAVAIKQIDRRLTENLSTFYASWADWMLRTFNCDVRKPEIVKYALDYVDANSLNPFLSATYETLRVVLARQGLLGPGDYRQWLTSSEIEQEIADEVLRANSNMSGYEYGRKLAEKRAEYRRAGILK